MKRNNAIEWTMLLSWPAILIVSLAIYLITGEWNFVKSFALGAFTTLLMQSWNYKWMKRAFEEAPKTIVRSTVVSYVFRFVLYGVILYFTYQNADQWNIYFTAGGILLYRVVMFPVAIVLSRKKEGDAVDRN
jgi:NhaP-type Na+/H+ or K+/H+ antiporter